MKCSTTTYGSDKERVNVIGSLVGGRNLQNDTFKQGVRHLNWDDIVENISLLWIWKYDNRISCSFFNLTKILLDV